MIDFAAIDNELNRRHVIVARLSEGAPNRAKNSYSRSCHPLSQGFKEYCRMPPSCKSRRKSGLMLSYLDGFTEHIKQISAYFIFSIDRLSVGRQRAHISPACRLVDTMLTIPKRFRAGPWQAIGASFDVRETKLIN